MITRRYSKAKANANRVTWTGLESVPVPFHADSTLVNGQLLGYMKVKSKAIWCHGFKAMFDTPAGASRIQCSVRLLRLSDGASMGAVYLRGVTLGGDKVFTNPVAMPAESLWCFGVLLSVPVGLESYAPRGLTATYQVRYANGPVQTSLYSRGDVEAGVGFDQIPTYPEAVPGNTEVDPVFMAWNRSTGINITVPQVNGLTDALSAKADIAAGAVWLRRLSGGAYRPLFLNEDGEIQLGDPTTLS